MVESSQTQYKGAGYNDLDLNMFSKPIYSRSNTSNTSLGGSSASVSANTSVTNLSSSASLPPPPPIGVPRSRKASGETKRVSAEPEEHAIETNVSEADLVAQMEKVLKKDNGLPEREFDHYCVKLRKLLPGLDQECRDIASHALVLADEGKGSTAKELLVQFMLRQSGSSSWAMPLRKVVENTK
ncbi:hypothetical protein B0I72DRAFT_134925 [Yarrowia lipolytica]|jgi:hypothetical protein|uniref:YALI0E31735p n=2 Tax=Yarrowia lipolytica TaxID=4952 RepID=Q6C3W1_YARLI|nr:YALI0E31735p [Yarrowia lipolytica CLIB122]KAB8285489.1 hypothetical protein BKA91DRAFT_133146 [Yarrowia lipolytica]KAE8175422.1 hypothetical protein BKA90DRAFT_132624 [Yarrowia lipolytica]KAJ8057628.1 hypothetical protein LXG23DRAFT_54327 [Yarrowia lipolytica]QNQ01018.1 Hypothetical protein YALI2_F00563g [Yarrowia lipolytica]RDW24093.1 hypothetical protein B0I71DRAFT_134872 [Yarrowia lipolytica]|eukprot:XP_504651.2 YALI0E31735p [Yarrowia lipolytica CLIB122]